MTDEARMLPLRVMICDRDPVERWLIGTYLEQRVERLVTKLETDQLSEVKFASDRGRVDLVVVEGDTSDESRYWLERLLENPTTPVVVLAGDANYDEISRSVSQRAASCLSKSSLSREELINSVDEALQKFQAIRRNIAHTGELERLANCDPLTGLLNRRALLQRLEEAIARARRYGESLSLLLLDLDRFERIKESVGAAGAEAILRQVAALLQRRTRDADILGRYGADEFLVIFPHTDKDSACLAADRLRRLVRQLQVPDGAGDYLTVSGGVTGYQAGDDLSALVYRVETCVCRAKENGRDRVEK